MSANQVENGSSYFFKKTTLFIKHMVNLQITRAFIDLKYDTYNNFIHKKRGDILNILHY